MIETEILVGTEMLDANTAIQTRVQLDPDTIERYRHALEYERDDVPPVVLFQDD